MEPIFVKRGDQYVEAGAFDLSAFNATPIQPEPPAIATDAELRAAIEAWQVGAPPIIVRVGMYSPIDVSGKHGIEMYGYKDERPTVTGLAKFNREWKALGEGYIAPYTGFAGRSWHWSKSTGPGDAHRRSACPDLFVVRTGDGFAPLRLVHDESRLEPGTYMIVLAGGDPNRPTNVIVHLPANVTLDNVYHAPAPALLYGEADGVQIDGFDFAFAGDTHKGGAFRVSGQSWKFDVRVAHACVGIAMSGSGHNAGSSSAEHCFQLGWLLASCHKSRFPNASASGNNTRYANPRWEAGGLKQAESRDNVFERFTARGNNGVGHWSDIFCDGAQLLSYRGSGNMASDVQIEHHMTGGVYRDLEMVGCRPFWLEADRTDEFGAEGPAGDAKIAALWVQSNIYNTSVIGARFKDVAVGSKIKEHERRGVVDGCTFDDFEYDNVATPKQIERMNDAQIRSAINQGAEPKTVAEWLAVRNTYGASV